MKKILLASLFILSLSIIGCNKTDGPDEPNNQTGNDPQFTNISQTEVTLGEEGGTFTITYEITNPVEGATVEANINVDWVQLTSNAEGSLEFNASANDTQSAREASIFVTYADKASFTVSVSQEAAKLRANDLSGYYYAEEYSPGSDNYYIHLSNLGFVDGYAVPNAWYYRLDLYSTVADLPRDQPIIIPNGTYTLSATGDYSAGSLSSDYSVYFVTGESGEKIEEKSFEEGTVVVSDNKIEAELVIDGVTHFVVYEGSLEVEDFRQPEFYSTLEEDVVAEFAEGVLALDPYEDYYECGYFNYMFQIYPESGIGEYMETDMVTGDMSGLYDGTYTAVNTTSLVNPFTFIAGQVINGTMYGTWYYTSNDGQAIEDMAPIVEGSKMTISTSEDGTTTITIDFIDDAGNSITGEWSGTPQTAAARASKSKNYVELPTTDYAKR